MIMAYALPVIEDIIPSTYGETKISSEFMMWKEAMLEEMDSLQKNDIWELSELSKGSLVASECMLRSKNLKMELLFATRPGW